MTLDVVALTQAMVRIPSLSGQESEMAALMGAVMREGFDPVTIDRNGSVLGLIGPRGSGLAVRRAHGCGAGHGQLALGSVRRRDPRRPAAWRGSTDMKGGIAAAIAAAARSA